jgi:hypothetical protein
VNASVHHFSNEFVNHIGYWLSHLKAEWALRKMLRSSPFDLSWLIRGARRGGEDREEQEIGKQKALIFQKILIISVGADFWRDGQAAKHDNSQRE